uniref:Proline-rich protein 36-like isoform X1 n=2 Tax=Phascolarctos cinereus TaxID=38626 RepID=A0A6P5JIC0_PHACI|nr:proline-rich protein 36-like isoform X1 [Phascolarctos cinereus]
MERRFRTYAKASSLVQIPQKALPYKTQSVLIPCPPHRIALLSKQDHQSQAEKMVCLRHQFSPHRSSPVCHKTEPLKNHNDKIKNKYELPTPPHPDHHGIHIITAELKCKTTASVDLFQWGEELTSPKQKFSPTVVPRGQAEAKHGPHYKVKHNLGSKQQTKAKLPPQHHPKNQATFLPFICQPGRTPPHYQSPTKYLLINIHTGPDWQPTPATTRQMNIRSDPDYQDTPVTPRPMNTGPNYQPTPATIRLMKTRPGPDYQTTSATPRPMNTGPGPNYQPTSAPPMNTGPGPDYQPTSAIPINTGPDYQPTSAPPMNTGLDYQPTSAPPMNTGPDYEPISAPPMNTGPGPDYQPISAPPMNTGPDPDYQPISAPPMNTGPGPDYQLTPAIPMNTGPDYQPISAPAMNTGPGPDYQPTPAIPMNTGPDYQPTSVPPMNTGPGPDYQPISAPPMNTGPGPDYQPTSVPPMNTGPGPDYQPTPAIPMNTGPDYQPISVLPMNTGPGPDYQPISAPPMNTGPGPDYQLTPAIPMNTGPDYQPTPAIPMNTGPDYQPMSATPRLMNTRSGLDYETISATTRLMNTGPDYQTTPATPRPLNIHPGPDCQTIPTILRYEHHSKAPPDPDAQDIPPPGIYHQAQMPLDKEDYGILLRLLSNQVKDPTSQYYQKMNPPSPIQHTETPTSDYNQAEDTPSSDQPDEAQPGNQHQTQTEQNRDTPRCLNDIKPFTIEGLITLSTQVVDKIISSIPEEKIKRDIYNQVRLWQMRGCPRPTHWPERYMSASYTICLICASWIPNGCPHVHGMKCSSLAQLLAVPTPLPDSEKMNMRFYLKVPQQKPNTISTVTDYPSSKAMPSSPSPDFPSCRKADSVPLVLPKLTWLDFILARHYQQKEEKSCPGQKPPELPLTSKTNIEEKMPMRKGTQFKSLLEKFQSRRKLN